MRDRPDAESGRWYRVPRFGEARAQGRASRPTSGDQPDGGSGDDIRGIVRLCQHPREADDNRQEHRDGLEPWIQRREEHAANDRERRMARGHGTKSVPGRPRRLERLDSGQLDRILAKRADNVEGIVQPRPWTGDEKLNRVGSDHRHDRRDAPVKQAAAICGIEQKNHGRDDEAEGELAVLLHGLDFAFEVAVNVEPSNQFDGGAIERTKYDRTDEPEQQGERPPPVLPVEQERRGIPCGGDGKMDPSHRGGQAPRIVACRAKR